MTIHNHFLILYNTYEVLQLENHYEISPLSINFVKITGVYSASNRNEYWKH
jgi:hypothetical protein